MRRPALHHTCSLLPGRSRDSSRPSSHSSIRHKPRRFGASSQLRSPRSGCGTFTSVLCREMFCFVKVAGVDVIKWPSQAADECFVTGQSWVGRVTQIIPPNYGIVDGDSFYVTQCVKGSKQPVVRPFNRLAQRRLPDATYTMQAPCRPSIRFVDLFIAFVHRNQPLTEQTNCHCSQMGDEIRCRAIPNLDGGQYAWRCIEVEVRSLKLASMSTAL